VADDVLDVPYVGTAEFRAHPTYLETSSTLRPGKSESDNTAELQNALLSASQWATDIVSMPLHAHVRVENAPNVRVDRRGFLSYHPEQAPVVDGTITYSVGADPGHLDPVVGGTAWLEQDGRVIRASSPGAPGLDALQLGRVAAPGELYVQWRYVAGWPVTLISAIVADAGVTTLEVDDPTGIIPGTVLRIWTPGAEEAVTVTAVAGAALTLARPTRFVHGDGDTISSLPTTIRQAVINLAVAWLMKPGTQQGTTPSVQGAPPRTATAGSGRSSQRDRLVAEACAILSNYQRIR
jgi:hypothetical protein